MNHTNQPGDDETSGTYQPPPKKRYYKTVPRDGDRRRRKHRTDDGSRLSNKTGKRNRAPNSHPANHYFQEDLIRQTVIELQDGSCTRVESCQLSGFLYNSLKELTNKSLVNRRNIPIKHREEWLVDILHWTYQQVLGKYDRSSGSKVFSFATTTIQFRCNTLYIKYMRKKREHERIDYRDDEVVIDTAIEYPDIESPDFLDKDFNTW